MVLTADAATIDAAATTLAGKGPRTLLDEVESRSTPFNFLVSRPHPFLYLIRQVFIELTTLRWDGNPLAQRGALNKPHRLLNQSLVGFLQS
jgi:hypothetical protein